MSGNPFTRHPREVGESYGQHLANAGGFGLKMLAGGAACLIHAVFPFLFVNTGSRTVDRLNRHLSKRVERADWDRQPII